MPPLHPLNNLNNLNNPPLRIPIPTPQKRSPEAKAQTNPTTYITGTGNTISIPSTYARTHTSPPPGTVIGIVLGSIAGFIFLLYLVYLSLTSGRRFGAETLTQSGTSTATPSEIVDVGIRSRARSRYGPGSRTRSRRGRDEVIVEESVTGTGTGTSAVDEGGIVEVIEEESLVDPPPSSSRYRSRSRSRSRSRERYRRGGSLAYGSDFS